MKPMKEAFYQGDLYEEVEEALNGALLMEDVLDYFVVEEGSYVDTRIRGRYFGYDNIYAITSEDFDERVVRSIFDDTDGKMLLDTAYEGTRYKIKNTMFGFIMLLEENGIVAVEMGEEARDSMLFYIKDYRFK